ncbi:hypothetical protein B566_EDAN011410 [Ephemera danica]|nr:hypothetical protein B566_EDAN011410 [Ephemera danica]
MSGIIYVTFQIQFKLKNMPASTRSWPMIFGSIHIFLGVVTLVGSASISDWFWGNANNRDSTPSSSEYQLKNGVALPEVPFESLSNDERFLQEAQYFGLAPTSQLYTCQQAVVLRLKSSCSSLSEEQLAKLSVALLNCQSAAEGRPQYPCSEDMSLRECTGDMDPDTWNTYHLMNNRARAVCLSSRQAQFRALTEMTAGQEHLGSITEETMRTVSDGQQKLMSQQQTLRAAQRNAHSFVAHSLRELAREKSIVAAGHRELARLAQNIKLKLDSAELDVQQQNVERRQQHEQLLSDLQSIQKQASVIWEDIDESTHKILDRHETALKYYEQTLQSLKSINDSISYLQNVLDSTRKEIDQRLGWIADTLGGAGGQLDLVIACVTHVAFLLMSMLTVAFLGAPFCTRVLLLLLVSLNIIQLALQGPEGALSLPATAFLLVLGTGVHLFINALHRILVPRQQPTAYILPPTQQANGAPTAVKSDTTSFVTNLQSTAIRLWVQFKNFIGIKSVNNTPSSAALVNESVADNQSTSDEESDSGMEDLPTRSQFYQENLRRMAENRENCSRDSPLRQRSRSGTPNRASTPRQQCGATCLNGQLCRLPASAPSGLCFRHARQVSNHPQ